MANLFHFSLESSEMVSAQCGVALSSMRRFYHSDVLEFPGDLCDYCKGWGSSLKVYLKGEEWNS